MCCCKIVTQLSCLILEKIGKLELLLGNDWSCVINGNGLVHVINITLVVVYIPIIGTLWLVVIFFFSCATQLFCVHTLPAKYHLPETFSGLTYNFVRYERRWAGTTDPCLGRKTTTAQITETWRWALYSGPHLRKWFTRRVVAEMAAILVGRKWRFRLKATWMIEPCPMSIYLKEQSIKVMACGVTLRSMWRKVPEKTQNLICVFWCGTGAAISVMSHDTDPKYSIWRYCENLTSYFGE